MRAIVAIDQRQQISADRRLRGRVDFRKGIHDATRLERRQLQRQSVALRGRVKVALPSIGSACTGFDEAFLDQLLEDPVQALLGDPQDVEQFGDGETWLAIDEMQHPMVRATEIVVAKDTVGIARRSRDRRRRTAR